MVRPKILILDEPLSGVDTESQAAITELLLKINREEGKAVFFSSHDLRMVRSVAEKGLARRRRPGGVGGSGNGGTSMVSFFDISVRRSCFSRLCWAAPSSLWFVLWSGRI